MTSIPMIMVKDVKNAAHWYSKLLCGMNDHDSEEFDRVLVGGVPVLMLHHWTDGEHGLRPPAPQGRVGDGVAIWFSVDDLDDVIARGKSIGGEVIAKPWLNPRAGWTEASLRDPFGYTLVFFGFS